MTTVARRREHDSGEFSDASHQENEQDNPGNGVQNDESDYDSAASDSERSERDPENQETERRVDDDEDRSNPQYIPKRGTFYEHDDRTAASGGEESTNTVSETASEKKEGETPSERRRAARKSETVNKWSHDKYNENEQMPKSRDELVAIYGYDIRNEDAPPHARRNRRYGRGPNKYTRTWEDEEAYKRQANAALPVRKPPNPEDFPELEAGGKGGRKRVPRPRSKSQPSSNESIENGTQLRRNASIKDRARTKRPPARTPGKDKRETRDRDRGERDREGQKENREMLPPLENLTITATVVNNSQSQPVRKVNATVAQQRPVPTELGKKKPPPPVQPQPQPTAVPNKSPPQSAVKPQSQPPGPPEPRGSKRYSSLRQRPLDTYSPPHHQIQNQQNQTQQPGQNQQPSQNQQHRYHAGEYPAPAGQPGAPHPQQLMQQMHRNAPPSQQHGPSPPHQQLPQQPLPPPQLPQQPLPQPQIQQQQIQQQQIQQQQISQQQISQQQISQQQISQQQISQQQQQVRLGILEQQQMVTHPHHTIHNLPPVPQHPIGQLQPTQAYAPPAMMPAQYMQVSQQGVSGAAFGGAAMYAQPAPYPHQLYPHNYVSSAGGVTYYSCAEQETLPRAQRRPTAAIPIVRPAAPDRSANSTEKDNIDRIVENMFVRKPWPSTHSADSKEKSEPRSSQEPTSKESSQPNSLTSSSISTDSKPSDSIEKEKEDRETVKEITEVQKESTPVIEAEKEVKPSEEIKEESISTDA